MLKKNLPEDFRRQTTDEVFAVDQDEFFRPIVGDLDFVTLRGRAALGYFSANCGGCHNSVGPLSRLELLLRHDVSGKWDAPGRYKIPGIDPDSSRIVTPGDPQRSALFLRMHSRRPSTQMPPLGTVIRDDDALRVVEEWIAGLQPAVQQ